MTTILAVFGVKALYLLYIWLISGVTCQYLSNRKGYGDRPGLATGLLLSALGIVVWLLWPARENSDWKLRGPVGRERKVRAESDAPAAVAAGSKR